MGRKVGHPETIDIKGSAPPAPPNFKRIKKVLEKGVARGVTNPVKARVLSTAHLLSYLKVGQEVLIILHWHYKD